MMRTLILKRRQLSGWTLFFVCFLLPSNIAARETSILLQTEKYDESCQIKIAQSDSTISVVWPIGSAAHCTLTFDLDRQLPLIQSMAIPKSEGQPTELIAEGLDPFVLVRVGDRDLTKREGWTIFFDRMQRKPHRSFVANLDRTSAIATSHAQRATLTIGEVTAGPFRGDLRWTFFAGSPFVLQECVVQTERQSTAFLYDMGLICRDQLPTQMAWLDASSTFRQETAASFDDARSIPVSKRAICAEFQGGSIALFPLPHRYFYPLDFSDNLSNVWVGPDYEGQGLPLGFGIRHDWKGDDRYVPWFNAPPKTSQELGMFLLFSNQSAQGTLKEVNRLTRDDRFEAIPGHRVFSSHYHVEHTREIMKAQKESVAEVNEITGRTASGSQYRIPQPLQDPGFMRVFRKMGIDIVHLAEFHYGDTPRKNEAERLNHLEHLHAECQRLSDENFLLLPGEEPNVHLGGHWISFFPKPVYWVLNRPDSAPFVREDPNFGKVYHVGSEADVLRLLRSEAGLAWTAHPRIKGSTGFPDRYRNRLFFQSDRFLGAAWKSMPADLSESRLGSRVLNLMDDMSNWGEPKYVLGEVDVFQIEPDHELYGHMNVNYLRMDKIPDFSSGWQSILDALRDGQFFVTTGEVLISRFTAGGRESGESVPIPPDGKLSVQLDLKWTFPLSYAEVITGNGEQVKRERIDLSKTGAYGEDRFQVNADVSGQAWIRVEVWDVATNGAFTQPVWIRPSP